MRAAPSQPVRMYRLAVVHRLCVFLAGLCSCTADAVVYRAALESHDAGPHLAHEPGDAGKAPSPRGDAGTAVVGCRSEKSGGYAILTEILARLNEDLLTPEKPHCSTNADCSQTFITPACDESTGTCVPCPDPAQQVGFSVVTGGCLAAAAVSCCRNPDAPADCILKACAVECGGN